MKMFDLIFIEEDFQRYITHGCNVDGGISFIKKMLMLMKHAGLFAVVNHRFGCWILKNFDSKSKRYIRYFFNIFYYSAKKISIIWGKIDIVDGTPIGKGLFIDDQGGVVIGAVSIGKNCTIFSNVTLGMDLNGSKPTLGNSLVIKSNSVVYGLIEVADGCVVDADTVLSKSIPKTNFLISGNPAKVIKKNIDSSDYILKD